MKETYIRFMANVNADTATQLLRIIDHKLKQGMERLHLLMSTPGGTVFHGNSIHNFLRGCPFEVYTYNFGTVDSIGVVIYSAGEKRLSVPHARFLLHPVSHHIQARTALNEKDLEERLKGLVIDQKNIARVVADTCGKTEDEIDKMILARTTLDPHEAKDMGLVNEIQSALIPAGADLEVIYETGVQKPQAIQLPFSFPIQTQPRPEGQSIPQTEACSRAVDLDHSTSIYLSP